MTTMLTAPGLCDACRRELERQANPLQTLYCEHHEALAVAVLADGRLSGYRTFGPCSADEAAQILQQGMQEGIDRHQADHATKQ